MTNLELAYLAGIVDGEGCFQVRPNTRSKNPYSQLSISNRNVELMEWIKLKTGYNYYRCKTGMYSWRVTSARARIIIPQLIPFLKIKKDQAKLVMTLPIRTYKNTRGLHDSIIKLLRSMKDRSIGK